MSRIATPSAPINHSRPIVGVAKRVRVIDGMPTMNVTIQWTIISESLDTFHHGFGATWGDPVAVVVGARLFGLRTRAHEDLAAPRVRDLDDAGGRCAEAVQTEAAAGLDP